MTGTPADSALAAVTDRADRDLFHALRGDADVIARFDAERWRALTEAALRTFAAPLLSATLRGAPAIRVPPEVDTRLARARALSAERWALSCRQLAELGEALGENAARCLVVKGAHIGRLYPVPGARLTGDIDLVAAPGHLDAIAEALTALGYAPESPETWREDHPGHHHLPPYRRAGSLPVELHWTLGKGTEAVDWSTGVWSRAVASGAAGGLMEMEPLDALLYAAKHLAHGHLFSTTNALSGLADAKLLVEACDPEADRLTARAREWNMLPAVAIVLRLARDLLGARVDDALLESLRVPGLDAAIPSATWRMLHPGGLGATRHLQLRTRATLNPPHPVTALRRRHPVRSAVAFGRLAALPLLDDLRLDHPRIGRTSLAPLGYPIHWGRLAWRHAGLLRLLDPRQLAAARATEAHHKRLLRAYIQQVA